MRSAALAGGVCWLAASAALAATYWGNRFQAPVQGMLVGMMFRLGLPMAAVVALSQTSERPLASGAATTILGVYLLALVVETLLAVRMVAPTTAMKAM